MAEELAQLTRISASMQDPIRNFADSIKQLTSPRARALTLFGAVVSNSFDSARHTVRSVLVVDLVELSALRRIALQGVKFGKAGIAAPLVMTPDYIKTSLDTFPLELIEIGQHHLTIFGDDYFTEMNFEDKHVRLQCERELKTILIGLRQGLLAAAGREKFIGALEVDIGEGLLRTLRGLLWLKGDRAAKPSADVLAAVEKIADRKLAGVRAALDASGHHGWDEFEKLYQDVEALGEIANDW